VNPVFHEEKNCILETIYDRDSIDKWAYRIY